MEYSEAISDTIEQYLNAIVLDVQKNMRDENANATGYTSKNIVSKVKGTEGVIIAPDSLESAQEGTPPKSAGGGITEQEAQVWISARGLDINVERLALRINENGSFYYRNENERRDLYTSALNNKKLDNKLYSNLLDDTLDALLIALD